MKPSSSSPRLLLLVLSSCLSMNFPRGHADDRKFTYTYEPETLPAGVTEFEQWATLRAGRAKAVGRENFNRWDLREELEYGVTDNYTIAVYLNGRAESYRDSTTWADVSKFTFRGLSLENRLNVLNPAEHPVGLTLYLEPRYSGEQAELEQKIILGQRHGAWKWALNLIHATEWEDNFHSTEGELELTFGLARQIGKRWYVGIEVRDTNQLPEYETWDNTAIYAGPVVSYRTEKWWAALSVMPQVYGRNFNTDRDGNANLELSSHERITARLLFGVLF